MMTVPSLARITTQMKRVFIALTVLGLLAACSAPTEQALPPGSTVLALGDSLTAGYGVTPAQAWPAQLADKTGWNVINAGISGNTSGEALQRLPALLEEHKPALVFITLGGNDMLRHLPEQETITNLGKMIALVRVHGAKPLLLATPRPSIAGAVLRNLSAATFYRDIAREQTAPLIEEAIPDVLSDPLLKVDQLHPNAEGHARLTEHLLAELKKIGYLP